MSVKQGHRVGARETSSVFAAGEIPTFLRGDAQPACAPVTAELFFPEGQGAYAGDARAICAGCPLLHGCHDYALNHPELHGVWAGTTFKQRQRIRRQAGRRVNALTRTKVSRMERAIRERAAGRSVGDIARGMHVNENTVSQWLHDQEAAALERELLPVNPDRSRRAQRRAELHAARTDLGGQQRGAA